MHACKVCVYVFACVFIYVHMQTCMFRCACVFVSVHMCVYIGMHVSTCMCAHVCKYVCLHLCKCEMNMYVYVYARIWGCVYMSLDWCFCIECQRVCVRTRL